MPEADDDVGHLDAGVVDVVLHLDRVAPESQHANERVAERRVPEVADMSRLVGIDGGVLDDGLLGVNRDPRRLVRQAEPREQKAPAIEKHVQIAVGRRIDARDPVDRAKAGGDLLRDRARRLAQAARQLEGHRRSQIAQRSIRRRLDWNGDGLVGADAEPLGENRRAHGF